MSRSDLEGSCVLPDLLEGRSFAEVDHSCLELEDSLLQAEGSLIQAEESCLQMMGSCCSGLLEVDCLGSEGKVGTEGQEEGMMVLIGHLGMEMGRLRAEEDREQFGRDMVRPLLDR